MKAFKAYDIRGVWGTDLNPELVYKIGFFLPWVLEAKTILVGRDVRLSSDEMYNALISGLTDAGANVTNAGLSTTPMIYWGTGRFNYDASVMITASHNHKTYNGLKFSGKDVLPVGYDNGLNKIEALIEEKAPIVVKQKGQINSIDLGTAYVDFLMNYRIDYSDLNISIDISNGMAGLFASELFGDSVHFINEIPDGNFPAHEPNPLEPENQEQIKNAVLKNKSHIGLIFDGDADRVMFIDEKGHFVSPDLIIALLGHYFFTDGQTKSKVVQDIRTSKAVADYLRKFNVKVETWKVGRAYGATKLKEVNGVYGGELAGHYYFRDFYFSDSGLMAAMIVLQVVQKFIRKGIPFSELISGISTYANTGEINFKIDQKQEAMDAVKKYFDQHDPPVQFFDFDGYRFDYKDWWFNIRPSNTEPYLRFLAEAKTQKLLDAKTKIIFELISEFK